MNAETKLVALFLANDEKAYDQAQKMLEETGSGWEAADRLKRFYSAESITVSTGHRNSSILFTRLLEDALEEVDWLRVVECLLD